ncbi:MAG: EAL domain-containing protein [Pseudomonadota bacterium]
MLFRESDWEAYPALPRTARWGDLVDFFHRQKQATFCAIVDADRLPIGIITLRKYQQMIATPYGHALNHRKGVADLMQRNFHLGELDADIEETFSSFSNPTEVLGHGLVLVDQHKRFMGGLNAVSVLKCMTDIHAQVQTRLRAQICERERVERQIRDLADTDPLTSVLNRRAFVREIDTLVETKQNFLCAFIDLDRFKPLNDRYGHAVGDQVLKKISERLQNLPMCNLPARLGGDEFAFVSFVESTSSARDVIDKIHDALTDAVHTDVGDVAVGASIGIASFPENATSKTKLLHAADRAMMRAKANGGGVCQFDKNHDDFGQDAETFELAVAHAVKHDLFKPAVQPIIDLRTGTVVGYEVLARWPDSGFETDPSPLQFIPAIERLGMMDRFFVSLLRQALLSHRNDNTFFAFNVSPSQLSSTRFSKILLSELKSLGVEGCRIELEVTEHVLFRNIDRSREVLSELSAHGVSLSLDDFGTGYSAISLLGELPFSKVKLDKSLLGNSSDETRLPKVLSACLKMCKELDLVTCTEGIEQAWQAKLLKAHGCDQAQGHFFGRPDLLDAQVPETRTA